MTIFITFTPSIYVFTSVPEKDSEAPLSDKPMAAKPTRKELLVFGWVHANHDIPEELTRIIKSFSQDAIQCKSSKYMGPIEFKMDGIQFQLSAYGGRYSLQLHTNSLLKDTLTIKLAVKIQGDENDETFHKDLLFDVTKNDYRIDKTIYHSTDTDHDDFDLLFAFEIVSISYYKMRIIHELEWKLTANELNSLRLAKNYIWKEMNGWSFFIAPYNKLVYADSLDRQLGIRPEVLPRGIFGLKIGYDLITVGSQHSVETMGGVKKINKYSGGFYEWNHALFADSTEFEILLNIEIIEILGRDDGDSFVDGVLKKELWSEYGFF